VIPSLDTIAIVALIVGGLGTPAAIVWAVLRWEEVVYNGARLEKSLQVADARAAIMERIEYWDSQQIGGNVSPAVLIANLQWAVAQIDGPPKRTLG
jgi:hypothetical protein